MFVEKEFNNMYNSNVGGSLDGFGDFGGRWRRRLKRIVKAPVKIVKTVAKTAVKLPTTVLKTVAKPVVKLAKIPLKIIKPITRPITSVLRSVVAPKKPSFAEAALSKTALRSTIGTALPTTPALQEVVVAPIGLTKTYDAASGQYYDANTGNLFDPNTDQYYDPYVLGKYYDPTTKAYHDTDTGEPIEKPVQEANLWQVMPPDMPQPKIALQPSISEMSQQYYPEPQQYYPEPVPAQYYPQPVRYAQPVVDRTQDLWYKTGSAQPFIQYDESSLPDLPDYSQWRTMPSMESAPFQTMYEEPAPMLEYNPETMPAYQDPYESEWWFDGLGEEAVPWYKKVASTAKGIVGAAKDIRGQVSEVRRDVKTILPKKKTETPTVAPMVEERAMSPLLLYGLGAITLAGGAYLLLRKSSKRKR